MPGMTLAEELERKMQDHKQTHEDHQAEIDQILEFSKGTMPNNFTKQGWKIAKEKFIERLESDTTKPRQFR